jgi:thymidylate synthase ThyX
MTIQAKIIADSVAPHGGRITTLQLRLHRFELAAFNTHRVFSRSASSSRAVPIGKLIEQVRTNPARPVFWGANQAGMSADRELDPLAQAEAVNTWHKAAEQAAHYAECLARTGVHKQISNRVLEPFLYVDVVVTSTDFTNFFALRDHADAQPEMRELARAMRRAVDDSTPVEMQDGEWHLPYVVAQDFETIGFGGDSYSYDLLCRLSTARCARVSYLKHDNSAPSVEEDLKLYDRLVGSDPKHASPCEHQATPLPNCSDRCRNFVGWWQYRATVERTSV